MYQKTEYLFLNSTQYYLNNCIIPYTEIKVYRVDENRNELYQLNASVVGSVLNDKQFAVDMDRGLIIFSPQNINNLFKVVYYTNGEVNPFNISENLFFVVEKFLRWNSLRIISGLYFYKEDFDEDFILRLKSGEFIYRGQYYTCNKQNYNFKYLSAPTISGKYRGYMFYIDENTIDNHTNLYRPLKQISKPSIFISNSLYEHTFQAKNELLERYKNAYPNMDKIIIAFVYFRIDNMRYTFDIEYVKDFRMM